MTDDTEEKKKPYRPKFDPKKFQNKWEAKITYMLLHIIADVEELTEKVKLQERKIEYLKEVNGNKSVH